MSKKNKSNVNFDLNNLNFLYGNPNCPSKLSKEDNSIMDLLSSAHKNSLDFLFITELNDNISKNSSANSNWQHLLKSIKKFNRHNNFIAVAGFEAKSSNLGSFNIINTQSYFKGTINNFNDMLIWMLKENKDNVLISLNNPKDCIEKIPLNIVSNEYIRAIEIKKSSSDDNYCEYENAYYKLLDLGWHISALNTDSNDFKYLTCAITKSFDKESLLTAFRKFHVFSTESKSLKLFFTINSAFMGDTIFISDEKELDFYVNIEDPLVKIENVEILSNKKNIIKSYLDINLNSVKILFNKKISIKESWYVIRVTLIDKKQAISSPIFIDFNENKNNQNS